jgi:hypothetical protein
VSARYLRQIRGRFVYPAVEVREPERRIRSAGPQRQGAPTRVRATPPAAPRSSDSIRVTMKDNDRENATFPRASEKL